MIVIEGSARRALQITQLAKHIISYAQIAGDLNEFATATQLLHMAEKLMLDLSLTQKNRVSLAKLLIGAHQRFWHLRDERDRSLPSRREARIWQH